MFSSSGPQLTSFWFQDPFFFTYFLCEVMNTHRTETGDRIMKYRTKSPEKRKLKCLWLLHFGYTFKRRAFCLNLVFITKWTISRLLFCFPKAPELAVSPAPARTAHQTSNTVQDSGHAYLWNHTARTGPGQTLLSPSHYSLLFLNHGLCQTHCRKSSATSRIQNAPFV